ETCTYDACQWSTLLLDDGVLWVGGYDELVAIDVETLQPVMQFLFSEQAHTFNPNVVKDIDVTGDGQLWTLFCWDTCYVVTLDRQKLLDGVDQEPGMIAFETSWLEFVANVGGSMWAGESRSGNVDERPATFYPLEIGASLGPDDGIALPDDLEFFILGGMNLTTDGSRLWLLHENGRRLYWFDPETRAVGKFQVYPGDEQTDEDPNMLMWLSFDGQHLWASGSETLRIALPWVQ
ncbi:MAG TPA: hypothetical protein VFF68_09485, partial [Anaerolineaceae bacterium]|nr:hypothetical protein [Anaerolineaceae bacterium]